MTIKFSQGSNVQKTPAVCRPPPIIPPGWLMPIGHAISGVSYIGIIMPDSSIDILNDWVKLIWNQAVSHWYWENLTGPHPRELTIRLMPDGHTMEIHTIIKRYAALWFTHEWNGPDYTYPDPWTSGPHEGSHEPQASQVRQSFYQLI